MKKQYIKIPYLIRRIRRFVQKAKIWNLNLLSHLVCCFLIPANAPNLHCKKLNLQQSSAYSSHFRGKIVGLCFGLSRFADTITIIKLPLNSIREMPAPIYLRCIINHCLSLAFKGNTARVIYPFPGGHSVVNLEDLPMR